LTATSALSEDLSRIESIGAHAGDQPASPQTMASVIAAPMNVTGSPKCYLCFANIQIG
jgi:hypothetical protein